MEKWSLTALAHGLLSHALSSPSHSGMRTLDGGHAHLIYSTMIALARGQRVDEDNPGEATVQVLCGQVRVTAGDATTDVSPGQLLMLPSDRHTVTALEDAVLLVTVAKRTTPIPADAVDSELAVSDRRRRPVHASLS
jgi:quercetin dioxygenase-like cupin family protein